MKYLSIPTPRKLKRPPRAELLERWLVLQAVLGTSSSRLAAVLQERFGVVQEPKRITSIVAAHKIRRPKPNTTPPDERRDVLQWHEEGTNAAAIADRLHMEYGRDIKPRSVERRIQRWCAESNESVVEGAA